MPIDRIIHDAKLPTKFRPQTEAAHAGRHHPGWGHHYDCSDNLADRASYYIALASLIVSCAYLSNPMLWWMAVGAIAGMIIGLGGVMAGELAKEKEPLELNLRLTFVAFQSMAGLIAGLLLGRKIHQSHLPTLREFLSNLSALTAGLYAIIVTSRFIVDGLEPARTLSSRLSTTTTILITLLAIPGSIGYLLAERRTKAANRNQADIHKPSGRR